MSGMSKNPNAIGVLLVILLVNGRSGKLPSLGKAIQYDHFMRDMHRMVDMMDKIDGINQLAFNSSHGTNHGKSKEQFQDETSSIFPPPPSGSAKSAPFNLNGLNLPNFNMADLNLPDLGQLMEMAGPLMSVFNGSKR